MKSKKKRFSIGLRTLKTAAAVVISMVLVDAYGTTSSKLIFAMLGAMAAMEPTFKESLESCMTQAAGMFFGAVIGVLLLRLPVQPLAAAGIGIVIVALGIVGLFVSDLHHPGHSAHHLCGGALLGHRHRSDHRHAHQHADFPL